MKVDFSTKILDQFNDEIPLPPTPKGPREGTLTLAYVACEALLYFTPAMQMSGVDKAKAYRLAMLAVKGGAHEITGEDAQLIRDRVGEIYAPVVVGRVYDLLEDRVVGEK